MKDDPHQSSDGPSPRRHPRCRLACPGLANPRTVRPMTRPPMDRSGHRAGRAVRGRTGRPPARRRRCHRATTPSPSAGFAVSAAPDHRRYRYPRDRQRRRPCRAHRRRPAVRPAPGGLQDSAADTPPVRCLRRAPMRRGPRAVPRCEAAVVSYPGACLVEIARAGNGAPAAARAIVAGSTLLLVCRTTHR